MAWRGRTTALELHNIEEFKTYLHGLNYSNWRPSGIVQHNTASPTLHQWWHSVPPAQRMQNLISYYRDQLGWSAGPHAFVDGVSIWVLTDFNVSGVHSPSWNATRLGIEMVGDYAIESDESGAGKKVLDMSTALFGECCAFFGWEPNNDKIKQHKEDPATDHDCPGRNVVKSEFLDDVLNYMGDGGDDHGPPIPERNGVVVNVAPNDHLNVRAAPSSSSAVVGTLDNGDSIVVVGEVYNGTTQWLRLKDGGWVAGKYVDVEEAEGWHDNITATVFAGPDDPQDSAYGSGRIDGSKPGVSLPYKWRDEPRPTGIRVKGPRGEQVAPVVDVGPWNTDDPLYVRGEDRPLVEDQYKTLTKAQNGQVPSNDAAIDLTPATALAVGIDGKGKVTWKIET